VSDLIGQVRQVTTQGSPPPSERSRTAHRPVGWIQAKGLTGGQTAVIEPAGTALFILVGVGPCWGSHSSFADFLLTPWVRDLSMIVGVWPGDDRSLSDGGVSSSFPPSCGSGSCCCRGVN
jgi:hypothetical protein